MRKTILGAASALALASPAVAADLPIPRYSEVPSYAPEVQTYEYRTAPPVVVEERAPVVAETVVVRRPVIVAPPPVVVDEYPVYAAPRVYAAPPVYAYAGPAWRGGWGHGRHFRGRW
jgi:opacity protein-like surface antigen